MSDPQLGLSDLYVIIGQLEVAKYQRDFTIGAQKQEIEKLKQELKNARNGDGSTQEEKGKDTPIEKVAD